LGGVLPIHFSLVLVGAFECSITFGSYFSKNKNQINFISIKVN